MQNRTMASPIEKQVVLVGAGNAHLVFIKRWGMHPLPGVAVTLVNTTAVVPYSAMIPGFIGGEYTWDEITIDLVRLCQSIGVRFLAEPIEAIDLKKRQVVLTNRPPLAYDVLSLGIGSLPQCPNLNSSQIVSLPLRPLTQLVQDIDTIDADLKKTPREYHLAVVGGGASGCELALAIHKRLGHFPHLHMSLYQNAERLVPHLAPRVAEYFNQTFAERGIACHLGTKVIGATGKSLITQKNLSNGAIVSGPNQITIDAVVWATEAMAHPLIRASGLEINADGFLQGLQTLQSVSHPEVFGTGDCISLAAYPKMAKNGVHAVRQGQVLFDNICYFFQEKPLRPYRPQRICLILLNTADGRAIMNYGFLTTRSRSMRRLKNKIDQAWMRKFTHFPVMETEQTSDKLNPLMRCGGCGSKISQNVLSAVLKRLPLKSDPRVLFGCSEGEDAAVHYVRPELFGDSPNELVEVQTVDYFKAMVDDPYLFGRIAALNAVSDLYAMNARPFTALAIVTLPLARGPIQEAMLFELLSGAVESLQQLGVVLTGGHTTEGSELALGFSVTGFAEANRLFQKKSLAVGDQLILTKPLGSGVLLAGLMRGVCRADWYQHLTRVMLLANAEASKICYTAGVKACTDVTGFGLAGHLLEMLDASGVSAKIVASAVPTYPGFSELVSEGIVSSLHEDNVRGAWRVEGKTPSPAWLFDPQTSGGLLGAVQPDHVTSTLSQLHQAGYSQACVIGEVVALDADQQPRIRVV